jgi:hypothetical protein
MQKEGKELEAKTLYQRGLADVEASLALDDSSAQAHLWCVGAPVMLRGTCVGISVVGGPVILHSWAWA